MDVCDEIRKRFLNAMVWRTQVGKHVGQRTLHVRPSQRFDHSSGLNWSFYHGAPELEALWGLGQVDSVAGLGWLKKGSFGKGVFSEKSIF